MGGRGSTSMGGRWLGRSLGGARPSSSPSTIQTQPRQDQLSFSFCSRNKGARAWVASIEIVHTQVIFHARKKLQLQRLKELAAARTADQLLNLSAAKQLAAEGLIPTALVQDLTLACLDTWTQRLTEQKQINCLLLI